jgi:hypothetical protein
VPPEALLRGSGGVDAISDLEERIVNLLAQVRAAKPEALADSLHARAEAALEPKPKERKP